MWTPPTTSSKSSPRGPRTRSRRSQFSKIKRAQRTRPGILPPVSVENDLRRCRFHLHCFIFRTKYAREVHRVVPQRDHTVGVVAAPLPRRHLHTLQGLDRSSGCQRQHPLRGERRRTSRAGSGRLQGSGTGSSLQHLGTNHVGRRDFYSHDGTVQDRTFETRQSNFQSEPNHLALVRG
jgi:hypothetical protein